MGLRYRDAGGTDDDWIEVPDGETFDLGFAPNFNFPVSRAVLFTATNTQGVENYLITKVVGTESISIQEYTAQLLTFGVEDSVLEGLEVIGREDDLPEGLNWGTSQGFALAASRQVGDPVIEAELQRIREDPTRSLGILQLSEEVADINSEFAQQSSTVRQFAAVRSFSASLITAIYSKLPIYPNEPQIVEDFTQYRSDRTLRIFDIEGNTLVSLQRQGRSWEVEELVVRECPEGTCPVDCQGITCCYDTDTGESVFQFPIEG